MKNVQKTINFLKNARKTIAIWIACSYVAVSYTVYAQSGDMGKLKTGLTTISSDIKSMYTTINTFTYIIAAVMLVIALPQLIGKFANSDQGATKSAIQWGAALLVLFAGSALLKLTLAS